MPQSDMLRQERKKRGREGDFSLSKMKHNMFQGDETRYGGTPLEFLLDHIFANLLEI